MEGSLKNLKNISYNRIRKIKKIAKNAKEIGSLNMLKEISFANTKQYLMTVLYSITFNINILLEKLLYVFFPPCTK